MGAADSTHPKKSPWMTWFGLPSASPMMGSPALRKLCVLRVDTVAAMLRRTIATDAVMGECVRSVGYRIGPAFPPPASLVIESDAASTAVPMSADDPTSERPVSSGRASDGAPASDVLLVSAVAPSRVAPSIDSPPSGG